WTFWMAAGTCVISISAVAWVMTKMSKQAQEPDSALTLAPLRSFGEEKTYFLENSGEITRQAEAMLKQYAGATSPEEVLPLVRESSRVKDRLKTLWKPMGA